MPMLFKLSTKKYMIMVKNVIDKIIKNMIKLFKKKKSLYKVRTKIIFYLKNYQVQSMVLRLVEYNKPF